MDNVTHEDETERTNEDAIAMADESVMSASTQLEVLAEEMEDSPVARRLKKLSDLLLDVSNELDQIRDGVAPAPPSSKQLAVAEFHMAFLRIIECHFGAEATAAHLEILPGAELAN